MREIKRIIIHCSATPEGRDVTVDDIRRWHVDGNKWSDIGYHYVVDIHGCISGGRAIDKPGAHVKGHNKDSVGVCYIGGMDTDMKPKDTMTEEQEHAIRELIYALRMVTDNDISLHGHNEFSSKACPSFKVSEKFKDIL